MVQPRYPVHRRIPTIAFVCSASLSCLFGQESAPASSPESAAPAGSGALPQPLSPPPPVLAEFREPALSAVELDNLVAPLALYPDALVALILPAATEPSDVVLAARFLNSQARPEAEIEAQPWIDSVKLLARYPTVIAWLDRELAWTKRIGEAFAQQPADVMTAIQRRRAQARASGALRTTSQHVVSEVESNIVIVPARPDVIYVPVYDPFAVYVSAPIHRTRVVISFGRAYSCGYWLAYGCDWGRRTICYVDRPHRVRVWHEPPRTTVVVTRTWSHPVHDPSPHWRTWAPRPHRGRYDSGVTVRAHDRAPEPSGGAPALTAFSGPPSRSVREVARARAEAAGVVSSAGAAPASSNAVASADSGESTAGAARRDGFDRSRGGRAGREGDGSRAREEVRGREVVRAPDFAPATSPLPESFAPTTPAVQSSVPAGSSINRVGGRRGDAEARNSGFERSRAERTTSVVTGDAAGASATVRTRPSRIDPPRSAAPAIASPGVLSYSSPSPSSESRGARWNGAEAARSVSGSGNNGAPDRSYQTRSAPVSGIAEGSVRGGGYRSGERDADAGTRLPD